MGKAILILALGMSLLVTMLIFSLNKNTNTGLATAVNSYSNTKARLIANSGIDIYLEKLREDKALTGNFLNNSLMDGTYDLYIYGSDTLYVKSIANYNGVTHTSFATATRQAISFPNINSAVYVSSDSMNLNLNGNMDISGNDHDINGNPISGTSVPGFGVDNPSDSSYVVNNIKNKITYAIQGSGGTPSVSTVQDTTNWLEVTENYIFSADISLSSGTYGTGTVLGTATDPKITYTTGDVNLTGTGYGYGILIVNGNLSMEGQFNFHGIVIAYGNSSITTKTAGNAGIFGASIFVGKSVNMQATGNAQLYYSSAAIDNAKANLKSSRFTILSWWE
jgi:hypothetical protein